MELKKIFTNKAALIFFTLICCVLWGSAVPFLKLGYRFSDIAGNDTDSQILYAGIRFTVAGLLALMIGSVIAQKPLLINKSSSIKSAKLSVFQTVLQYTFFYIGLARSTGTKSSVITASNVFLSILIAALVFKTEKLTIRKIIGCIIGFSGVLLINMDGIEEGFRFTGEGFIFLSALSCGFSAGLIKKYSVNENATLLSGWQFVIGGVFMTFIGLVCGGRVNLTGVKSILILIYLSFVSAVAFSLWGTLLKYNPVSSVSVFGFMNPVFGVILSYVLLSEKNDIESWKVVFALLFVSCGIIIVNTSSGKKRKN